MVAAELRQAEYGLNVQAQFVSDGSSMISGGCTAQLLPCPPPASWSWTASHRKEAPLCRYPQTAAISLCLTAGQIKGCISPWCSQQQGRTEKCRLHRPYRGKAAAANLPVGCVYKCSFDSTATLGDVIISCHPSCMLAAWGVPRHSSTQPEHSSSSHLSPTPDALFLVT